MNIHDTHRPDYHSYLLRLWRDGGPQTWRGSLQCTATDQLYHFVSVEALIAFLTMRLAESKNDPQAEANPS
jgi:hypothetical protein